jgi:acyl-CoA reductase-like NAD-dependent aldehyde dehydrogenase
MPDRLEVAKTYKLFIDGKFPRSESGRTVAVEDGKGRVVAHTCRASRKDLRDAVAAARKAFAGWSGASAYLRGQILYRMAEMMEGKREEFEGAIGAGTKAPPAAGRLRHEGTKGKAKAAVGGAAREVAAAIDRLVAYAGWADKYAQVLGCNNPVAGPYYNFTVPQPTGVVGVIAPDDPPLLGLVSLIAPALCAGNTIVALGGETTAAAIAAVVLGEVCATSDVPPGAVNLLTGLRDELVPVLASHRDIDAIHAAGVSPEHAQILRAGAAENVKRVTVRDKVDWLDAEACHSPWWIEPLVEMKTIWHPSAT